jgi:Kef-type K+ transport system membrane component KefB
MNHLAPHDVMVVCLTLATLLASAKVAGELVKRLNQPAVLGEIVAGILLGPTVLGHFQPVLYDLLFPHSGPVPLVLDGVTTISVVFFLLTAGIEIDLSSIFRQGKTALLVSASGIVIPFAFGFVLAGAFPRFLGATEGTSRLIFALFMGTALSISALPVVARILMDLGWLRTEMGTVVMSSAMFDDLAGWILFGLVFGMLNPNGSADHHVGHTHFSISFCAADADRRPLAHPFCHAFYPSAYDVAGRSSGLHLFLNAGLGGFCRIRWHSRRIWRLHHRCCGRRISSSAPTHL